MKSIFKNKFARIISLSIVCSMLASTSVYANANIANDLDSKYWAYSSIKYVISKGIMVGDFDNNFKPNDYIDKFQATKIFAVLAGYKYDAVTKEEELYYTRCYENNKTLLNQYSSKYKKWNSIYNKEIAYLLEKEILTVEELSKFIGFDNNKLEVTINITREESLYILSKIFVKNSILDYPTIDFIFADDKDIYPEYKNIVYYFSKMAVIKGNTEAQFKPKDFISRAEMSVFVDRIIKFNSDNNIFLLNGDEQIIIDKKPLATKKNDEISVETFTATISKIHSSANAIEVTTTDNRFSDKVLVVSKSVSINIDGYLKTYIDLKEGMDFYGVILNNEVISITGSSHTFLTPAKGEVEDTSVIGDASNKPLLTITITEIVISNKINKITTLDELGVTNTYYINSNVADIYSLRIDNKYKITLNSLYIESIKPFNK